MDKPHMATSPSGDERDRQFEAIVVQYERALLRYVGRILNESLAAQDVVQNTFIKLFKGWNDELETSPQLSSWLYRVAHNCAVDYIRKESRRTILQRRRAEEDPNADGLASAQNPPVSDAAEMAGRLLRELSLKEQQVVVLKVYEEKSYREIAEITGLSDGNVGYILHHAMKKLAQKLKNREQL